MHELALGESLVAAIAERVPKGRIVRVRIEVGALVAVVLDALRTAFEVCARGTRLEGAVLEVVEIAARGRCRACGGAAQAEGPLLLCGCGSADVELESGQELRVREVEAIF